MYPEDRALALEERLRLGEGMVKTIFIHAFMDVHTFEVDRIKKCCTHYALPDGRLMPGCAYNLLYRDKDPRLAGHGRHDEDLGARRGRMTRQRLAGKRALVTGASRGLGRAVCEAFARHGAKVAFTYTKDAAGAEAARGAIEAAGGEARAFAVSVTDAAATAKMVKELEAAWGGLDVLVNNAGITQNLPLALLDEEDWDRVMDVNVKGTFLTSKAVLRGMIRKKSGVVVNIGSRAGVKMIDAPIHYCASKAAVVGLTQALAKEVGRHGVRVVCVAPGLLEDGVGRNLPDHRLADYLKHCALGPASARSSRSRRAGDVPGVGRQRLHERRDRDRGRRGVKCVSS